MPGASPPIVEAESAPRLITESASAAPDSGRHVSSTTAATRRASPAARTLSSRLAHSGSTPPNTTSSGIVEPHDVAQPRHPSRIQVQAGAPHVDIDVGQRQVHVDPARLPFDAPG